MKNVEFIRWGGLSSVKQKGRFVPDKILNSKSNEDFGFFGTFHRPPARKGIYAFVPRTIEMFLVSWKIYNKTPDKDGNYLKKEFEHPRKFNYSGKLWTHIYIVHPEITYYRQRDSWYETDTDSFEKILSLHKWELSKEITRRGDEFFGKCKEFSNFVNAWKCFSKDHFEVFIEKVN